MMASVPSAASTTSSSKSQGSVARAPWRFCFSCHGRGSLAAAVAAEIGFRISKARGTCRRENYRSHSARSFRSMFKLQKSSRHDGGGTPEQEWEAKKILAEEQGKWD
ncbi:hypothetical protein AAZV13_09G156500 [Glycine max]|nr:hypothetical protein GYH30_025582 [Glycine max]